MVENLLNLSYRSKQIIIINDGSTDDTLQLLQAKYELIAIPRYYQDTLPSKPVRAVYRSRNYQEIIVVDKENGEKFDALNAGLNLCDTTYYITVDADTYIDNDSFEALIRPIFTSPETIAIGASVRIRNGCTLTYNKVTTEGFPEGYVTVMQSIEYLRAFLERQGWDYVGGNYVISGAFAVFATGVVKEIGGYAPTVANDLEIILRLNRILKATNTTYTITYQSDPAAWTEGPSTIKSLDRQRLLWHRGLMESIWFHKILFFNPAYGAFGLFVYPFLVFGEAIEPIVEMAGLVYIIVGLILGVVSWSFTILLLLTVFGFNFLFTLFCLLIEELTFKKYPKPRTLLLLIWYAFVENFGYRQLCTYWRLRGIRDFFRKFSGIQKDSDQINQTVKNVIEKGKLKW